MARTIKERFIAFHKANPDVYRLFDRFALEAINSGMKKVGSKFVFERIRWETSVNTTGAGWSTATKKPLKLNNNFTAWYARLFMMAHPEHAGTFETREAKK